MAVVVAMVQMAFWHGQTMLGVLGNDVEGKNDFGRRWLIQLLLLLVVVVAVVNGGGRGEGLCGSGALW